MDRTDFKIDSLRLDWEWNRQADLAFSYGEHQADCQSEYDRNKNALELAKAESEMEIRKDPASFGIAKITDKVAAAAVLRHEKVKESQNEVIESRHALDIAKAACNGIEHKKRGLEKAVSLFLAGYYGEPKAEDEEGREATEEYRKKDLRSRARKKRRTEKEN